MPHPIRDNRVLEVALKYLSRRQLNLRPTTMRQLCRRVGLGKDRLTSLFEIESITYVLMLHPGKRYILGNIELLLVKLPEELADRLQIDNDAIYHSYLKMFKKVEPEPLPKVEYFSVLEDSPGDDISPEEMADPYFNYRINTQQFRELENHLIKRDELFRIAKERGYTYAAIYRAIGGSRMRWVLAGPMWRPYLYGKSLYFHKDVLKVLHQSDRLYKNPRTAIWKRYQRQVSQGEYANPGLFANEKLKDYLVR